MTMAMLLAGIGWFALGTLIGTLHVLTLGWNVRLFASGNALVLALLLQALRLGLVALILAEIALRQGARPLLIAAAGLVLARVVVVRQSARA